MDVSSESSSSRSTIVCLLWISEFTPLPGIYFQAERMVDLSERNASHPEPIFHPYEMTAIRSTAFLGFLCSPPLIPPQGEFERRDWKYILELLPHVFLWGGSPLAERIHHHCSQA